MAARLHSAFGASRCALGAALVLASCSGSSGSSLIGLGDEFDIAALSDVVLRLCGETQCTDYSHPECEFYLRYDTLTWARFSEEPDVCFAALLSELDCLAETGSCSEERCFAPDDACQLTTEAPDISVPEALEPAQVTCDWWVGCEVARFEAERDEAVAECQADLIAQAEIYQHDRGPACAERFVDLVVCIGNAQLSCDADGDDEDAACPEESTAFSETCYWE